MEPMHKVEPWPRVEASIKAHAVSLLVGRYFGTATLISHFSLEDWLAHVAVLLDGEVKKIAANFNENLPETTQADIPVQLPKSQVFALETIRLWKTEPSISEQFPVFNDWLEHCEKLVNRGVAIHNLAP